MKNTVKLRLLGIAMIVTCTCALAYTQDSYQAIWGRQFGSAGGDQPASVAVDSMNNIVVTGHTMGTMDATNKGRGDGFVVKYNDAGDLLWLQQFGTPERDLARSVATDAVGNIFLAGYTEGDLGMDNLGREDAFLIKYDTNGNIEWTKQFGTSKADCAESVAIDSAGNIFVAGHTYMYYGSTKAFLSKYDTNGNMLWSQQLGASHTRSYAVAVDQLGNALISGYTTGVLGDTNYGGMDAFIAKYDTSGQLKWVQQFGSGGNDSAPRLGLGDDGSIIIGGTTYGSLAEPIAGLSDAFLAKFDMNGNLQWSEQFGTPEHDGIQSIAIDAQGAIFASGTSSGNLGGINSGGWDAFVTQYSSDGSRLWFEAMRTEGEDQARYIAVDGEGNLVATGITGGSLFAPNIGFTDAFLVKFAVPEPTAFSLLLLGMGAFLHGRCCRTPKGSR